MTRSPGPLVVDVTVSGTAKRRKVLTRIRRPAGRRALRVGDRRRRGGRSRLAAAGRAGGAGRSGRRRRRRRASSGPSPGCASGCSRADPGGLRGDGPERRARRRRPTAGRGERHGRPPRRRGAAGSPGRRPRSPATPTRSSATALAGGEDYELLLAVPRRAGRRFAAAARLARLPVARDRRPDAGGLRADPRHGEPEIGRFPRVSSTSGRPCAAVSAPGR